MIYRAHSARNHSIGQIGLIAMSNALKIETGSVYRSDPRCSTDMHGGGILFAKVVEWNFHFGPGDAVQLSTEMLDYTWPVPEAERCREAEGSFAVNDRGYLHCQFPSLEFWARPCANRPELLICSAWRRAPGSEFSFTLRLVRSSD